jgi:DinB family protein
MRSLDSQETSSETGVASSILVFSRLASTRSTPKEKYRMNAQDAIRTTMDISSMVLQAYIGDFTDDELMCRPAAGCNHIAWQLGHLIASECGLLEAIRPGTAAALPDGFAEAHGKEMAGSDDPDQFCSKQEYIDLNEKVRAASLAELEKSSSTDLDEPSPEQYRQMFPTVGSIFALIATHGLMHSGQFVPVRRALNKPVVI